MGKGKGKGEAHDPRAEAFVEMMRRAELSEAVIDTFVTYFDQLVQGATGVIEEAEIGPVPELPTTTGLRETNQYARRGEEALGSLVVIRLNGGLGTSMGLERAKSLLPVKGVADFNAIIAQQLRSLFVRHGTHVPLLHMTSFSTEADITKFMEEFPDLLQNNIPATFLQNRYPKVYADTFTPAAETDGELNWNPPGHGDIYASLVSSGTLEKLLKAGKKYAFIANADNLGATVNLSILGYISEKRIPFLMEVARRTEADKKGGHLARRLEDGRLILRESAQAPKNAEGSIISEFQDIRRYSYFNTNSIWVDLEHLQKVLNAHGNVLTLPLIRNEKTVNPRDPRSRKVYQLETAMGAAISVFDGASAIEVERARFAPVKTTSDLLAVRSDAYDLSSEGWLALVANREHPPLVDLDQRHYKLMKEFDARIAVIPSLKGCARFTVKGNIDFTSPLEAFGTVRITDGRAEQDQESEPIAFPAEIRRAENEEIVVYPGRAERTPI